MIGVATDVMGMLLDDMAEAPAKTGRLEPEQLSTIEAAAEAVSIVVSSEEGQLNLWGTSGEDIFTVGHHGAIMHFDGQTWSSMKSPVEYSAEWFWLLGVWGTAGDSVYAVGDIGTIVHYDGSEWSYMRSGAPTTSGPCGDRVTKMSSQSARKAALRTSMAPFGLQWKAARTSGSIRGVSRQTMCTPSANREQSCMMMQRMVHRRERNRQRSYDLGVLLLPEFLWLVITAPCFTSWCDLDAHEQRQVELATRKLGDAPNNASFW